MAPVEAKSAKRKLLDDSDSDSEDGGAAVQDNSFKVNEEYARRFEYNKKREERQRLEEKYKNDKTDDRNGDDDDGTSSSDETEDEDGFLATEDLDAEISATLQAIRTKDPRVYDKNINFYHAELPDGPNDKPKEKKAKPVFLQDYHREKLMRGDVGASDDEEEDKLPVPTYAQEQDALQKSIISQMHASGSADDDSDADSDDFVVKRKEPAEKEKTKDGVNPARAKAMAKSELDVTTADRDPETFLSNFMTSRAWVPEEGSRWAAFESDDGEGDDDMAETFEEAYNMRFENPEKSNEVLKSYARDMAAARSVRREEKNARKRRRDLEKEKKEEEKRERKEDKARLRKLKLEEAEEKLKKIKQAAGASGKALKDEEWLEFLDDAWEDGKWEEEMAKRFGDDYYAIDDEQFESGDEDGEDGEGSKKKRLKKPKWDDDIDIGDIVPDFDEKEAQPKVTLSDNEGAEEEQEAEEDAPPSKKRKTADHKKARREAQKQARAERTKLEALVDSKLELTNHDLLSGPSGGSGGFRYRETEPMSFGMTARDILLAPSDAALNEYAGLKKLAHFRQQDKKERDVQRLSKKKRLRKWRRDTFGKEYEKEGPTYGFEKFAKEGDVQEAAASEHRGKTASKKKTDEEGGNIVGEVGGSRKKRKRSKAKKQDSSAVDVE